MKKRLVALLMCSLFPFMTACSTTEDIITPDTTGGVETSNTETTTPPDDTDPDPKPVVAPKLTAQEFQNTIQYVEKCRDDKKLSYAAFAVGNRAGEFFHWTLEGTNDETLFDMASVTKAAVVTPLFLLAQQEGLLHWSDTLDMHVNATGDKAKITLAHLLTHSSGISTTKVRTEVSDPSKAIDAILSRKLAYKTGSKTLYSCSNFILLGHILEQTYGKTLDVLFLEKIAPALNMPNSGYKLFENATNIAKHQSSKNRVNDGDAHFLGDVAGNAGLFSNIVDMASYATELSKGFPTLISPELFQSVLDNRIENRCIGLSVLADTNTVRGQLLLGGSYGHTGYTGQSVYADPETGLWVVALTNTKYHNAELGSGFYTALAKDLLSYEVGIGLTAESGASSDPVTGAVTFEDNLTVSEVVSGSLADGILQVGDIIVNVTVNGNTTDVKTQRDFVRKVVTVKEGDVVTLKIRRGTEEKTVDIPSNRE